MRRRGESASGGSGTTFKRWYPLTDAQFSVRAVLRDDAGVHERINYSPYGVAEHHWGGDVDNDRSADFFDWLALGNQVALGSVGIGQANYIAEMDLNRDGVLDSNDSNAIGSGTALPSGWISAAGAGNPGNVIGFDGYVFNPEIETYSVRFRWYDPELGRWLQRDPLGYVEGLNLYQYVGGMPTIQSDYMGLGPPEWMKKLKDGVKQGWEGLWAGLTLGEMRDAAVGDSATTAYNLSKEIAKELHDPECENSDEVAIRNAARHLIWQALLTIEHGEDTARTIGDIHESGQEGSRDSSADQINNQIGRVIGEGLKGRGTVSEEDLKKAVIDVIESGAAISDYRDPRLDQTASVYVETGDSSEGCNSCDEESPWKYRGRP